MGGATRSRGEGDGGATAFVFTFPDVGEGIHEGRVVEWLVSERDTVAEDQPLVKVETDKAIVELPSPKAGTVLRLHVPAETTIEVGDPLVSIGERGAAVVAEASTAAPQPGTATEPQQPLHAIDDGRPPQPAKAPPSRRPLATPRTRALARRLGVDLSALEGSGRGGRITDEDVERAAAAPRVAAAPTQPAPSPTEATTPETTAEGEVERIPLTHLRRVIADAMHASKQRAAHVTHVDEADVTELVALQQRMKAALEPKGVRLTLLPLFVKALVAALEEFPVFNASVDEERQELVLKRYYNIGIAVDTPEGLIVPVLKGADRKDMATIARELGDLAERARERRLTLDELRGGTCTITNIGPLGGVFATPIINQPELAIVGLHSIKERPAVVEGEIAIRKLMYLSVSFDHRWVDGAEAARFMSRLVELVSDPALLMARL